MVLVGKQVSEYVEYSPAVLKKIVIERPKYAPKAGQGKFVIADLPSRAFAKSTASSSLISWILVRKFVEHMPFYRQQQAIKRDHDWHIPSSTINDWFIHACTLLEPLYNLIKEKILASGYVQADESPIRVLESEKKGKSHLGYQWVYHSPLLKLILFNYRKGRGANGPKEMLDGYQGILQCDGYKVYDKFELEGVILTGCMAHTRRYFHKALDNDNQRATKALNIIGEIYSIERECKEMTFEQRKQCREQNSLPLMNELKEWIEQESIKVLPKSPIGKAMTYTQNQWHKLMNIFIDGRCQLDNNLIENKIRPLALGRKNYLFAGSHKAGQRIAMMYTFFACCKANGVNEMEWLKNTLDNIDDTKMSKLHTLIPGWAEEEQTSNEQQEIKQ